MKLKVGDKVRVIAGSSKGKEGKITKTLRKEDRVIVEGVNIVKKHKKGNGQETGGILEVEAPIHVSNVMLIDPKTKKPTRIGYKLDEKSNKKERISKKSNEKID
ncbi:MAG: 50S ribosomal protein L24 [Bacilli bacterium]|nr:50S ribosomal protein L24 [Bacilli bacterium]